MLRITLASLHLLALALGLMATVLRGSALREPFTPLSLKRALRLDAIWGIAAALWIVTGLWRVFGGIEKPTAYYLANHWFLAKMGCFLLIFLLEIWPMLVLTRARAALRQGLDAASIVVPASKRIALIGHVQATIALVMVFMAVAMARGELQQQAHAAAGGEFNLDSPKQLQQILFEKLQLPVMRKTPTGQPSTAEDVLEELADDYELPRLILEYRGLAKLKSTYTDKLPEEVDRPLASRAHQLPPGRGGHRSAVVDRSEPAEHPHPHAGRTPHPPGLHRATGTCADGGGLFADRAAHHGAPVG